MERFEDAADPRNGPEHHTGKPCIEKGCDRPAGTSWSPHWCQQCNAKRMMRIDASLKEMLKRFES